MRRGKSPVSACARQGAGGRAAFGLSPVPLGRFSGRRRYRENKELEINRRPSPDSSKVRPRTIFARTVLQRQSSRSPAPRSITQVLVAPRPAVRRPVVRAVRHDVRRRPDAERHAGTTRRRGRKEGGAFCVRGFHLADGQSPHEGIAAADRWFTGEFRADTNFTYSSTTRRTTPSAARARSFVTTRSSSRSSASAATSITTTCAARLMTQFGMYSRRRRATTPARRVASGTSTTPTATSPRRTAATTGTR